MKLYVKATDIHGTFITLFERKAYRSRDDCQRSGGLMLPHKIVEIEVEEPNPKPPEPKPE